jgi:hypothetical protein
MLAASITRVRVDKFAAREMAKRTRGRKTADE